MLLGVHWSMYVIAAGVAWAALAFWRPGSVALASSWIIAQVYAVKTGDSLPIELYRTLDALVIAALCLQSRVALDWFILSIFPLQWWVYSWSDEVTVWWILWALALAQMVLAGPWPMRQQVKGSVSHGPRRRYVGEV